MTADRPAPPGEPTYAHDADCNTPHTAGPEPCPPPVEPSTDTASDADWGDNHCLARFASGGDHGGFRDAIVECETRSAARDAELATLREQRDQMQDNAEHWADVSRRQAAELVKLRRGWHQIPGEQP